MRVLVIAPHADDEILGVGGTIAKYIDEGHEVFVCIMTTGHPSMYPDDILKKTRAEVIAAHNFLGIKDTFFLEFPAVMISETPKYEINKKLFETIEKVKPDTVFIPHFGDMHYDHYIVTQSAMVGLRPINEHKVVEIYSYETLSETEWNIPHAAYAFIPNTFIDITKHLEKKRKAMSFYKTQLKMHPHARSIEAIEALAKLRGSTIGVGAAEAFCLIRRIVI
jgi:LmbE family N-acetylglucosaminyl deacetylase